MTKTNRTFLNPNHSNLLRLTKLSLFTSSLLLGACSSAGDDLAYDEGSETNEPGADSKLEATIGPEGGELVGANSGPFKGLKLTIPEGALDEPTNVRISVSEDFKPLPETAVGCGTMFDIEPAGLKLNAPAVLSVPFDEDAVMSQYRFGDEVKVWAMQSEKWGQRIQLESTEDTVTVEVSELNLAGAGVNPVPEENIVFFDFTPSAKFQPCFAEFPEDEHRQPFIKAAVVRGEQNDGMFLLGDRFVPGIQFDLFTLENSNLDAEGDRNPDFEGFGLAWYQTDLHANNHGKIKTAIRGIFLDQIFGLDSSVDLGPTNTFHAGFWFNNPEDAAACGFEGSTPFNGEHNAGPLAMVTRPNPEGGLGPLCAKPNTSTTPTTCDP